MFQKFEVTLNAFHTCDVAPVRLSEYTRL